MNAIYFYLLPIVLQSFIAWAGRAALFSTLNGKLYLLTIGNLSGGPAADLERNFSDTTHGFLKIIDRKSRLVFACLIQLEVCYATYISKVNQFYFTQTFSSGNYFILGLFFCSSCRVIEFNLLKMGWRIKFNVIDFTANMLITKLINICITIKWPSVLE